MANISTADGNISLLGSWRQEDLDFVNWMFAEANTWYYGIHLCNHFTKDEPAVGFWAEGRWVFSPEDIDERFKSQGDEEIKEKYQKGIKSLFGRSLEIEFDYIDVEGGCMYLAKDEVTLMVEAYGEGDYALVPHGESLHMEYDYTWKNFGDLDVSDPELYDEIVSNVELWLARKIPGLIATAKGDILIENWVSEHIPPNDQDYLDEGILGEVLAKHGDSLIKETIALCI